jgi:hypothetical protein
VIEIDKRLLGPELALKLFSRHHLTGMIKEESQDTKRLFLEANAAAVPG